MKDGFIKLFRKVEDWEHYRDVNVKCLFLHILIKANYEEKTWQGIKIKPGEFITSRKKLALESGLSEQQVRTALEKLKATQSVTQKSTKSYTLIKVKNWGKYTQCSTQSATTTKEIKEILYTKNLQELISDWNSVKEKGADPYWCVVRKETKQLKEQFYIFRKNYTEKEFKLGANNYIRDCKKRKKDNDGYYMHRFTLYAFLKQSNGLNKYINQ